MGDRHSRGWPAAEPGAAASRSHEPLRSTHRTARQYRKAANKKTIPPYQRGLPAQAAYPDTPPGRRDREPGEPQDGGATWQAPQADPDPPRVLRTRETATHPGLRKLR